jgi:hypothetical protein
MAGVALLGVLTGPGPAVAIEPEGAATKLMALTNITRTSNGLSALSRDTRLSSVAVERSRDMITRNYFSHQIPPNNTTVVDIVESLGVRFRSVGENIEFNTALINPVEFAQTDFMNSPEHRENLLSPRWDRMGAGVFGSGSKVMYAVEFMQSPAPESGSGAAEGAAPQRTQLPDQPNLARGERLRSPKVPIGLMENLVSRVLRLFLSL